MPTYKSIHEEGRDLLLFDPHKLDLTGKFCQELSKRIKRLNRNVPIRSVDAGRDICSDSPALVICHNHSGLRTDIDHSTASLIVSDDKVLIAIVVLHVMERHALPFTMPTDSLLDEKYAQYGSLVDYAYTPENGIYNCDMNMVADRKMSKFLQKYFRSTQSSGSSGSWQTNEAEKMITKPTEEVTELRQKLANQAEFVTQLREENTALRQIIAAEQMKNNEAEIMITNLQEEGTALSQKMAAQKNEADIMITNLQEEGTALSQKMAAQKNEVEKMTFKYEGKVSTLRKTLAAEKNETQTMITKLNEEVAELRQQMAAQKNESEKITTKHTKEVTALRQTMAVQRHDAKTLYKSKDELTKPQETIEVAVDNMLENQVESTPEKKCLDEPTICNERDLQLLEDLTDFL